MFVAVGDQGLLTFRDLHRINMHWAEHVRPEYDPLAVRREGGVWFEGIVVFGEVYEPFALEFTAFGFEEVYPLPAAVFASCCEYQ